MKTSSLLAWAPSFPWVSVKLPQWGLFFRQTSEAANKQTCLNSPPSSSSRVRLVSVVQTCSTCERSWLRPHFNVFFLVVVAFGWNLSLAWPDCLFNSPWKKARVRTPTSRRVWGRRWRRSRWQCAGRWARSTPSPSTRRRWVTVLSVVLKNFIAFVSSKPHPQSRGCLRHHRSGAAGLDGALR